MSDIPAKAWNSDCSVCGDSSGVCQPCEAGFCKNSLHVTCAQRFNLLEEESSPSADATSHTAAKNQEMAWPFFVYCKTHASREPRLNRWYRWCQSRSIIRQGLEESNGSAAELKRSYFALSAESRHLEERVIPFATKACVDLKLRHAELTKEISHLDSSYVDLQTKATALWKLVFSNDKKLNNAEVLNMLLVKSQVTCLCRACSSIEPPIVSDSDSSALARCLVQCERCLLWYHAGCVDPPMRVLPRKNELWRCEACHSEASNLEDNSSLDSRRRHRPGKSLLREKNEQTSPIAKRRNRRSSQ